MQLFFSEDLKRDIWNWQDAIKKESYGMQWRQFLPSSITVEKVADDIFLRNYLENEFYKSGQVNDFKEWLTDHVVADQIEKDLASLMQVQFLFEKITAYITTFRRAPYDVPGNSFFLMRRTYKREISATSIYHELMHFLFHWHYWNQCRDAGLCDQEIHSFKESLTVLLNPTLEKRGLPLDEGYPMHQEFRKKWTSLYEEYPDFPVFFEKALAVCKDYLQKKS